MAGFSAYQSSPVTAQAVVTVNAGFDRFFCSARKGLHNDKTDDRYRSTDEHCYTVRGETPLKPPCRSVSAADASVCAVQVQQRELVFRLNPKFNDVINRPDGFNGVNDIALKVRG